MQLPLAGGFAFVVDYLVACKLLVCHAANYVCTGALRVCMEGVVALESGGLIPLSYRDTRSFFTFATDLLYADRPNLQNPW